jgi:hypothetical protein
MQEAVARLMDEARRKTGQDIELVRLIEPLIGRRYGKQAISHWALGRAMPPASVLLAACKVTELSIDAALFGESQAAQMARLREGLDDALRRLDQLEGPRSRG